MRWKEGVPPAELLEPVKGEMGVISDDALIREMMPLSAAYMPAPLAGTVNPGTGEGSA